MNEKVLQLVRIDARSGPSVGKRRYKLAASESKSKVWVRSDLWADGLQVILLPQVPPDLFPVNNLQNSAQCIEKHDVSKQHIKGTPNTKSTQEYAPGVQSSY